MDNVIPDEAGSAATRALLDFRGDDDPEQADAVEAALVVDVVLDAAVPLILAADYDGRAWAYDAASGEFAKRAERLMSEQPEGFQSMADRLVGRAIALEQEAAALRARASVLRGEGDPTSE